MALGFKCGELNMNDVENLINSSLTNLKDLLYPIGCIVQTTAYSTVEQMCAVYGGQDWDLIEDRVLMGASSPLAATQKYTVGDTGGSDSITLTTANLPSHNHTYTLCNSSTGSTTLTINQIPSHTHKIWDQTAEKAARGSDYGLVANNSLTFSSVATGGSGSHSHSISRTSTTTGSTGSGTSVNVLNPYFVVYIWTRTV